MIAADAMLLSMQNSQTHRAVPAVTFERFRAVQVKDRDSIKAIVKRMMPFDEAKIII